VRTHRATGTAHNGIVAEGLVREYGPGFRAVDGIDLEVHPGEIFGFLGPNGAGKSTTVLMLTTLLPLTAGTARVAGLDIVKQPGAVRGKIGAALQSVALDPLLTGREHMRLQAALHGLRRCEGAVRADELLERMTLAGVADRRVAEYSGGNKRRLDLALALLHRPETLFLDEPTTGLDVRSRTALWEEIERLARQDGVTVFLTTQYLEEADSLAGRVAIIDGGRIVDLDVPERLKARIGCPSVAVVPEAPSDRAAVAAVLSRFGETLTVSPPGVAARVPDAARRLGDIVRAFDAVGLRIADLQLHAPTLDDVFLARTGRSLEPELCAT
jgi:ABC-2 type transport system ATP-binding protein